MYSLTIHFGPNAVAWSFMFKDSKKAEEARNRAVEHMINSEDFYIEDDYGQQASFSKTAVHGILLENIELVQEARIIRSLDQALGNARTQKRAASNPELQALMQRQGPGVLTPFSNGGFR